MVPAIDPADAASDPHIVLGLVGAPGAAFSLARELADSGLNSELDERLPGARWCIEVMEDRLVQPPATDAEIVKGRAKDTARQRVGRGGVSDRSPAAR